MPLFVVADETDGRQQATGTRAGSALAARLFRRPLESATLAFPS